MTRVLSIIVGTAAIASVLLNAHPVFFEEPPELWNEMHNVREALLDPGDQVCLPTVDIRGVERFASTRFLAEWRARIGLLLLGMASGVLAIAAYRKPPTAGRA